jgi:hypothetical protein
MSISRKNIFVTVKKIIQQNRDLQNGQREALFSSLYILLRACAIKRAIKKEGLTESQTSGRIIDIR